VIAYWLKTATGHTNRRIGDEIGVHGKTVEEKRRELEAAAEIPHLDKLEGKDGKMYPRTMPRAKPPPPPTPSLDTPSPVVAERPSSPPPMVAATSRQDAPNRALSALGKRRQSQHEIHCFALRRLSLP